MSTKKSRVIQPLRIALLCASALMLSTAFAEDGSNLSDIQYHPGSDNGPAVNSGMNASVVPAEQNGYISELREIQYHPGSDNNRFVNSESDQSVLPADIDYDGGTATLSTYADASGQTVSVAAPAAVPASAVT